MMSNGPKERGLSLRHGRKTILQVTAHSHVRGQLLYAMSGVMRVKTGDEAWIVPTSRAMWLPARVKHEVQMSSAVAMRTLYIHPKSEFQFPSKCRLLEVSPLLRELILAAIREQAASRWSVRIAKIIALVHEEVQSADDMPFRIPLPQERRLQEICAAILRQPSMRHSLTIWARRTRTSERTLARLFNRETGMSFRYWRQQVVLSEAVALLARKTPVRQIAKRLGYRSGTAFSVMFQEALGQRPGQYNDGLGA
jgi:AraC-like DNA-binding protein